VFVVVIVEFVRASTIHVSLGLLEKLGDIAKSIFLQYKYIKPCIFYLKIPKKNLWGGDTPLPHLLVTSGHSTPALYGPLAF